MVKRFCRNCGKEFEVYEGLVKKGCGYERDWYTGLEH